MVDPLTPDDVEHEDDRDRYERRLEQRLEQDRYAGIPPLVAAARRDQALIDATLCDNECTNCDGKGYYMGGPHTTCPTCKGTGIEEQAA